MHTTRLKKVGGQLCADRPTGTAERAVSGDR